MESTLRKFIIFAFIWVGLFSFSLSFAQKPELVVQSGHSSDILSVSFSPEGKYLITGSQDNTAKLWEIATGREIRTFRGHSDYVESVSFSPNGKYLVTGSRDKTAKLWEVITGKQVHTFAEHSDRVTYVDFITDGRYVLTCTGGLDAIARLWDIFTGEEFIVHSDNIRLISPYRFSSDGKYMVTCSIDNTVKLWDVVTGDEIRTFRGHSSYVTSLSLSSDGKYLVTGSGDKTAKLWEVSTGQELHTFNGHSDGVCAVAFSADSKIAVTGSLDRTAKLWDVVTGHEIRNLSGHSRYIASISFSPDDKYVVTGSGDATAKLWDVTTGQVICTFSGHSAIINSLSLSLDSKYLVTGSIDNTAKLWNFITGQETVTFYGHSDMVKSVNFSPCSKYVITGSRDSTAKLWEVTTGRELRTFHGHSDGIESVSFSPKGEYVGTGSRDNTAKLWEVSTGQEIRTFAGHTGTIRSVCFSPNGKYIFTGSWDGTSKLWEVNDGQEIRTFGKYFFQVSSVSFSPDGKFVVVGGYESTTKLWEISTGQEIRTFAGHTGNINSVCFSPDGKYVVTGSEDNTAKLWEVSTGKEIRTFIGQSFLINSVSFSPDGMFVVTGSYDATTKIWEVETGKELATLISIGKIDWAVTTLGGLFDASKGAEKYIHFVRGLEVIELKQLKERYYEPGLLAKIMGFNDEPLLNVKALSEAKLYPEIELNEPNPDSPELEIHLKNRGGGIGRVVVFINDKEIGADARDANADPNTDEMNLTVDIGDHPYLIPGEDNVIDVKAFNADGYLSSRNVRVIYKAPVKAKVEPPTLWGIVAGVSEYHGDEIDLRFAAKDAMDMAQALNIGAHRLFGTERTYVTLLTTEKTEGALYPNKDNLFQAFSDVAAKAKSTDILVVYLAGHGVTFGGQEGDYYYLTAEASSGNLKDEAIRQQRAISSQELTEQIKKIPALKQVLILDTCRSGRFSEDMTKDRAISSSQIRAYERMKDRTGLHILAGAATDAVAYESSSYGQGILTYSLLLGMRGAALRDDEYIDISRLFQYSADQVPELAKNIGGIQRPIVAVPYGGTSFDIGRLGSEDKPRIPIAQVRPLVLRVNLNNEMPPFDDNLNLSKLLNEAFRDISARGRSASLVFVDADEFPQAYKLSGRYKITGGNVTVTVYLLVGKETRGNFQVKGDVGNIKQLVADILRETERWISR